jgi:hypothetical protein
MEAYWGSGGIAPIHSLTSALGGNEWSASRPGCFTPRESLHCYRPVCSGTRFATIQFYQQQTSKSGTQSQRTHFPNDRTSSKWGLMKQVIAPVLHLLNSFHEPKKLPAPPLCSVAQNKLQINVWNFAYRILGKETWIQAPPIRRSQTLQPPSTPLSRTEWSWKSRTIFLGKEDYWRLFNTFPTH